MFAGLIRGSFHSEGNFESSPSHGKVDPKADRKRVTIVILTKWALCVLKLHWQLKRVRSWKTKRSWDKKTKTVKSAPPVLLTLLPSPTTPPSTSTTTGSKYRRQPLIQEIQLLTTRKYNSLYPENTTDYINIQIIQQLTSRKWNCPSITTAPKQEMGLLLYRKYRWQPLI